jgi:hypothetical protein
MLEDWPADRGSLKGRCAPPVFSLRFRHRNEQAWRRTLNRINPQNEARLAGLLYVIVIVTAFFAEGVVRSSLIVPNNAAATAHNLLASERLYRLGGMADLINLSCDIVIAIILYDLLKTVARTLALSAAAFRIAFDVGLAAATMFHFAPLYLLKGPMYAAALPPAQLQAAAFEMIQIHNLGYNLFLIFFAVHLLLLGYLIIRSTFLPRLLGALLLLTGLCYLTNSFLHLVYPEVHTSFYLLLPGLISEFALAGWLLVRGVNVVKWRELEGRI